MVIRIQKGNLLRIHKLWGKVAELKKALPFTDVQHTLGHQKQGIRAHGNSMAIQWQIEKQ